LRPSRWYTDDLHNFAVLCYAVLDWGWGWAGVAASEFSLAQSDSFQGTTKIFFQTSYV